MTEHRKLLPINSKISYSEISKNKYHVLKSYNSYAVVNGNWSVLETATDKHRLGDCKHCRELLEYLDEQQDEQHKEGKEED